MYSDLKKYIKKAIVCISTIVFLRYFFTGGESERAYSFVQNTCMEGVATTQEIGRHFAPS